MARGSMASGPGRAEADEVVEQGPELPEQVAGMSDDVALAELRGWIARSEAHKRVWDDFSHRSRKSQEHPVIVD